MPVNFHIITRTVLYVAILMASQALCAQKFKVASFRVLTNDVSAFVNPVTDLNDEACALIKVQASPDFEFSTPLGIVRRIDKTGEIWLFIPKGSKKITLKHPEWGVLRDYAFPSKIESHVSYELRVDEPSIPSASAETIGTVTTVHDTLIVTRTDTLMLRQPEHRIPLSFISMATASLGGISKTLSGGVMMALMKRHGGFLHVSSDFGKLGKVTGFCDKEGFINGRLPYYSGETRHSFLAINAGAIHRLSGRVNIFEGIGYGSDRSAWGLAQSEGGQFVENTHYSHQGLSFEAGATFSLGKIIVSASCLSIRGTQWYATFGIGYKFGKENKDE